MSPKRIQFPAAIVVYTCECFENIQAFNLMFLKLSPNMNLNLYSLKCLLFLERKYVG